MKTNLSLMCVIVLCASLRGVAMPTEAEVEKAVPKVERMLASEKVALESGKMTRAEVAAAAMKLAAGADDEAAKLLLMKGAFILHVKDGDLEKAVKTINALETAIADMPPQVVTNIIETALLGLPKKATSGARLYRLLDEGKRKESNPDNSSAAPQVVKAAMKASEGQEIVDGYTWSYAIRNGGASIEAPRGKYGCAVSPNPDGSVVIPAKLGGVNVTRIGRQAFARCHSLTSVTIPPTVTSIGMSAFYECRFDSVEIPPSVKEIESLAFYNNRCLKSVEVPEGVTSIGDEAFGFCADLESVVLPSTLVNIGRGVFACGGKRLRSIFVSPKNPKYAMYNDLLCTKDGRRVLASVGGDVVIPEGVVNIDDKAFLQCSGLTSVSISASVERISDSAFEWCEGIESFSVSPDNGMYSSPNGLLCSKDGKTLIAGVNGYVRIPEGVTDIEKWAFAGRRWLTTVTIPSSVKRIGDETFRCCRGLESVTMEGEKPSAKRGLFDYCENLKVIHVPADAKSWAGMNEWLGVPLVFDAGSQGQGAQAAKDAERQARLEQEKVQREAARAEQREQLLAIQDELARVRQAKAAIKDSSPEVHKAVEGILKGMIKVPGRDYWLSATEVTQEQWEPIMEFNLSMHKGAKLPVEMVSRDDCDVFLEKLNQTKEVLESGFEFRLPELEEWKYAAWAGSAGNGSWIKPGVVGNVLDMAWVKENSSNETHAVAIKAPNAFGFYDMMGNVWEWLTGDAPDGTRGALKGCAFRQDADKCTWNQNLYISKIHRPADCGLRLAAHKKALPRRPILGGLRRSGSASNGQQSGSLRARRLQRQQEAQKAERRQENVGGYTWSFRVNNGEAEIVASGRGCAISPMPTGNLVVPSTLGGAKVTAIGQEAFIGCSGLKSLEILDSVTKIGRDSFQGCSGLTALSIPSSVTEIGIGAFIGCSGLTSVTISPNLLRIGYAAFSECDGLKQINVDAGNPNYASTGGVLYTKNMETLVQCPGGVDSVVLPSGLENIYWHSLRGCRKLKSLTIPPSVTTIGAWAFARCDGLESITLPQGVTAIHDNAFRECGSLKSLSLPDSVTDIGGAAFRLCTNLTFVTIPANVTRIGVAAFTECSALKRIDVAAGNPEYVSIDGVLYTKDIKEVVLCPGAATSVTVPESVTNIKPCAFEACEGLTSVTLPECVTNIGPYAFKRCVKLTAMTLPKRVASIGCDAFIWCNGLTSVKLPEGLSSIGWAAFAHCVGLKSLIIPSSVTTIAGAAFSHCSGLESMVIPSAVKSIEDWTFDCCEKLTVVTLPDGVARIGQESFRGCANLTSLTIPSDVRIVGRRAFEGCGELSAVTMRGGRPSASNDIFADCGKLKAIHVPANAKSWAGMKEWQGIPLVFDGDKVERLSATIDGYTWSYSVKNGEATIIPEGKDKCAVSPKPTGAFSIPGTLGGVKVTAIGRGAFSGCKGLTSVKIPEGVTGIGEGAFGDCTGLTSVSMPSSLVSLGDYAFGSCSGLKSVEIPARVRELKTQVFLGCTGLESVTIPAGVERIGSSSFGYCNALKEIRVDEGNRCFTSVDGVLYTRDRTELVACPDTLSEISILPEVRNIGQCAFLGCYKLTNLTIPEGVTNIAWQGVKDCPAIKSVTIPSTVRSIGEIAFAGCGQLMSVSLRKSHCPVIQNDAFKGCGKLAEIRVPSDSLLWSKMKSEGKTVQGIPIVLDSALKK